jgi:hypothetical protein
MANRTRSVRGGYKRFPFWIEARRPHVGGVPHDGGLEDDQLGAKALVAMAVEHLAQLPDVGTTRACLPPVITDLLSRMERPGATVTDRITVLILQPDLKRHRRCAFDAVMGAGSVGLRFKSHMLADTLGRPLRVIITT